VRAAPIYSRPPSDARATVVLGDALVAVADLGLDGRCDDADHGFLFSSVVSPASC
jgi:hypothetical protein